VTVNPQREVPLIRSAQPGDLYAIAAMHVRSWREGFGHLIAEGSLADTELADRIEYWRDGLFRPGTDALILVAEADTAIIGACLLEVSCTDDDITDPGVAEIAALYVDPVAWRTGTAKALLHRARLDLRARGQHTWMLWTLAEHAGTRAFYSSEGFGADPAANERRHRHAGPRLVRLWASLT
jgi:GNAT superfamily N-acetyltransferase